MKELRLLGFTVTVNRGGVPITPETAPEVKQNLQEKIDLKNYVAATLLRRIGMHHGWVSAPKNYEHPTTLRALNREDEFKRLGYGHILNMLMKG